jgi:hypothetical protein
MRVAKCPPRGHITLLALSPGNLFVCVGRSMQQIMGYPILFCEDDSCQSGVKRNSMERTPMPSERLEQSPAVLLREIVWGNRQPHSFG